MRIINRREFVTTAAAVGTSAVVRAPLHSRIKTKAQYKLTRAPQSPKENVRLQPGVFSAAAEANRKYLKTLAPDKQEPAPPLQLKGKLDDPASWLQPGDGRLLFRGVSQGQTVSFVPFASVLHQRYFVYHEIQS